MYVAELIAQSQPKAKVQALETPTIKRTTNLNRKVAATATAPVTVEKNNGSTMPRTRQATLI
jgi:hypothetical protein